MKIAVFNCPRGVTGKGILEAFVDAGLPLTPASPAGRLPSPPLGERAKGEEKIRHELVKRRISFAKRYFGIEKCFVRNLAIGRRGDPKTLKLLRGFVLNRLPVNRELVTPEGARLLAALCEKEISIPAMRLEKVGFGPDGMMVSIGETVAPWRRERVLLLETNLDDMSPQGFELLYERLFKAGALDVWVQPILMKKMRPAFKLSVLLNHTAQDKISEVVFKETPSLGVRFLELDRFSLPRKTVRIKTRWGPVRFKAGLLDSKPLEAHPEYEDLKRIARRRNLSFRRVQADVRKEMAR